MRDVSYDEALSLGVIKSDYKPPEKSSLKSFNEKLEADLQVKNGNVLGKLRKIFGDQIRNDNGTIKWRQDVIRDAFMSNKPFTIKVGCATDDLLKKLPPHIPQEHIKNKNFIVNSNWLDKKRKDGSNHRNHFYPLEYRDTNIPLTVEDLELIPSIWRNPDNVSDKTSNKWNILCEQKAIDGGIYKLVVNVEEIPKIVTFYKIKSP